MNFAKLVVSVSLVVASFGSVGCMGLTFAAWYATESVMELPGHVADTAGAVTGANKRREKERLAKLPLEEQALESPGPFPIIKIQSGGYFVSGSPGRKTTRQYASSATPDVLFREYDEHFRAYGYRLIHDDIQSGERTYRAKTITVELRIGRSGRWYSVQAVVSRSAPRPTY